MIATLQKTADFFKGAGEPTRLRILGVLRHGELCVCDIMAVLDLPQSTASRHLAYLRNAGWLESRRKNKWVYYKLQHVSETEKIITDILNYMAGVPDIQKDYDAMARHLAEKKTTSCAG